MNESNDESDLAFPKGMAAYLRTRLQLASIETQEALTHFKGKVGPLFLVLVCATGSYFLILAVLVSLLGKLLSLLGKHPILGWELAALLLAGLHIALIFAMKKRIIQKPTIPLYEYSRAELEHDREWIKENNPKNRNSSAD